MRFMRSMMLKNKIFDLPKLNIFSLVNLYTLELDLPVFELIQQVKLKKISLILGVDLKKPPQYRYLHKTYYFIFYFINILINYIYPYTPLFHDLPKL